MKQFFALMDCNSFYCSCERLFRPDLKHKPVGVLSNNDGCFISRTDELKALGVKMGDPHFKVKDICRFNDVAVFSANFSLYANISNRVMGTLRSLSPQIEVYSIDEAFLDCTGISKLETFGKQIKSVVERNTGIPVGVGIGTTKTLAKIANKISKKEGRPCVLESERDIDKALANTKVADIWKIGSKSAAKLKALGIHTAKEFSEFENEKLIQKIFTKTGLQTKQELYGQVGFELEVVPKLKKQIMCSRSFGSPVFTTDELKQSVASYVSDAAQKLRKQGSVCSDIEVFFRTSPFNDVPQHRVYEKIRLDSGTSDTLRMICEAIKKAEEGFKWGFEYKKAGVRLTGIDEFEQLSLLGNNDTQKRKRLMEVMDAINRREGSEMIKSAACGVDQKAWKMNRNFKSPRYVTGYTELPLVY